MNCRPGCMAMVIAEVNCEGEVINAIGHIARTLHVVGHLQRPKYDAPMWLIDPPIRQGKTFIDCVTDRALRPLDDPDENATDEMVRMLGQAPSAAVRNLIVEMQEKQAQLKDKR